MLEVAPIAGLVFAAVWCLYEINEDMHINDQAWKDIVGFLLGLPIGTLGYIGINGLS